MGHTGFAASIAMGIEDTGNKLAACLSYSYKTSCHMKVMDVEGQKTYYYVRPSAPKRTAWGSKVDIRYTPFAAPMVPAVMGAWQRFILARYIEIAMPQTIL